jgi:hypothetical protein
MLRSVAAGSVVFLRHINLLGEYDFSEEKLRDSFGIKPPRILDFPAADLGKENQSISLCLCGFRESLWNFRYLPLRETPNTETALDPKIHK